MDYQEIQKIRDQYLAGQWPKYLESVTIEGLRGWTGQMVRFQYPVSVVVGENGTGKSTVLKTAACAYENTDPQQTFYPSDFFIQTHWDAVQNAALKFTVRQGTTTSEFGIKKGPERWRGSQKRAKRQVFYFDISRTLPLDASAGYARLAKLAAAEVSSNEIVDDYRSRLSHVLGRDYTAARFATSDVDSRRQVGLLTRDDHEISQYHQGAGEDATLDLFRSLQQIPDTSLLIIDELEASLHPRAQRRLTRFLLWLARQKRIQVIVSSHSPYVLQELPAEARIMLLPSAGGVTVVYGISPEFAMSRLDDEVHSELHLFVEDREAATLLREIIAKEPDGGDILGRIQILPVGAVNVVQMMGQLGQANRLPFKSLAVVDGGEVAGPGVFRLPGDSSPEVTVYAALKQANWPNLSQRFGVGAGNLHAFLEDAMLAPDHHTWNASVGDRVVKSRHSVWETVASEWARSCLTTGERDSIVNPIKEMLA